MHTNLLGLEVSSHPWKKEKFLGNPNYQAIIIILRKKKKHVDYILPSNLLAKSIHIIQWEIRGS